MFYSLIQLDKSLTHAVNSLGGRWGLLDVFGVFVSEYLIFLMFIAGVCWSWKHSRYEGATSIMLAGGLSQLCKRIISMFYFRERPDIVHLFNQLPYSASFPSGHSSGAFSIAFSVLLISRWKSVLGWWLLFGACLVAFGRVFEGLHYVSDVVAGVFFGFLSAWVGVKGGSFVMERWNNGKRT